MRIKNRLKDRLLQFINLLEKTLNRLFVFIRVKLDESKPENLEIPNSPENWEKMYLASVTPVNEVKSEIAKILIELTQKKEKILETGCGSGNISAELALTGRNVAICDFSQPILDRVKVLFSVSDLGVPEAFCVNLMKVLPFSDNQFDVIWNSGVLEHWTDNELRPIIRELARCTRRCVISLVPNEKSVFYRYGRETSEQHNIAPWGREIPRTSLKGLFEEAGLVDIVERTVCTREAPNLISILDPVFRGKICQWWNSISESDPVKEGQGYLLLTVGYKQVDRL